MRRVVKINAVTNCCSETISELSYAAAAVSADVTCGARDHQCPEGAGGRPCIPDVWLCNGRNDCGDNSDEDPQVCQANGQSRAKFYGFYRNISSYFFSTIRKRISLYHKLSQFQKSNVRQVENARWGEKSRKQLNELTIKRRSILCSIMLQLEPKSRLLAASRASDSCLMLDYMCAL